MKVFTAIYKRCYRALSQEFKKLYRLNQIYLDPQKAASVTENPITAQDFSGPADDIVPAADPSATSMTDKMAKAQGLGSLVQLGLDRMAVLKRILEAMEIPNSEELFPKEPPPPPPEVQKLQMEQKMKQEEHQLKMQEIQMELQAKQEELEMEQAMLKMKLEFEMQKLNIDKQRFQMEMQQAHQELQMGMRTDAMGMQMQEQQHNQKLEQGAASHDQKMKQTRQTLTLKKEKPSEGTTKK